MRRKNKTMLLSTWLLSMYTLVTIAAGTKAELESGMVNPGYEEKPDWFKLSFLDLREDVSEAAKAGKRVLLYFYQDGCPYCKKLLQDNFGQRKIANKTKAGFDVIAINMWGNKEVTDLQGNTVTEKQFSRSLKVNYTPTLLFLNESGEVVLRVNGYYFPDKFSAALDYVAAKLETRVSFREYYKQNKTGKSRPALRFEPGFLKPPYDLQAVVRKSSKPLLVLFEQPHCKACDELHDKVLQHKITRQEMKKLNIALVDMWSKDKLVTPDGTKTTVADWASKLNIKYSPSLVYFDSSGKEVFRAEAYLKAFHVHGTMAYVHEKAYLKQPEFQRYLQQRRKKLEKKGIKVDLWE